MLIKARWLQAVLFTALTFGQTMIDLRTQSKSVDFSGANTTTPMKTGTVLPSTCTVGEMFYLTSAAPGSNVYGCTSQNAWSLESGGSSSSGSTLPSVTGNSGKVLTTDGTNVLWTGLGGDLSGAPGSATVIQLQGLPVTGGTPATGQILTWTGSAWSAENAPSGSGSGSGTSGATMASQLGDFLVTRTNSSTLAIGANCSAATPCNLRFGGLLYAFTSGATVNVSSGTGFAFIYVTSAGTLTVGSSLGLSCSGCIVQSGITGTPADSIPLFFWAATNGAWAATGVDQRAFISYKEVTGGTGISVAPDSQGHTVISADPNVVPLRTSAPATSSSACTPGSWANDTSYFYLCVNQNQWLRAALATF
jgi:hypothetical protein